MDHSRLRHANAASAISEACASAKLRISQQQSFSRSIRERALTAWSHLSVDAEPFVTEILDRLESARDKQSELDSLSIDELFLCHACSTGNQLALEAFCREYEDELKAAASKLRVKGSSYDDMRQMLWRRLFVGDAEHGPTILHYRGTGPLRHWFRVLATRSTLDYTRRQRVEASRDSERKRAFSEMAPDVDPELDHIRERYRHDFRSAFEEAVGLLTAEERNLLRCTYLSGMSTEAIGRAFGMHKATAARHLARAREKLLDLTRAALKRQLGADSRELDSVIRLFDGELSISISRLLR